MILNLKSFLKTNFFLILIILIGLFARTFRIQQSPARLTHDEMSIGYNAFSILETSLDEWGRKLPLSFEAFGDHKLPGYIYTSVPFIYLFGLNVISIKTPSIIAGLLIILFSYLITKKITKSKQAGLFAALFVALNPWPIHISRMALESNLALALYSGGLFYSLSIFENQIKGQKKKLIFAGILFALSCYTYVAFRLITALTLVGLTLLNIKSRKKFKLSLLVGLFYLITLIPLLPQLLGTSGSARFSQVSIFSDEGITAKVTEQRNFCFLQERTILPKICKIFFNKYLYIGEQITKDYVSFLLPTFLFIDGDKLEYLNDPDFGEYLIILIPFYLIGVYQVTKSKYRGSKLILLSFFLAPIASSLVGNPQIVRGSSLLLFVSIFSGLGLNAAISIISNQKIKILTTISFLGAFLLLFIQYFISYTYVYPGKYANYIYPLDQRTVEYINSVEKNFDTIYISNQFPDAHILLAFYNMIDPSYYLENVVRPEPDSFGFSHPTKLGKYQFGPSNWGTQLCKIDEKVLFVTFNEQFPQNWSALKYIHTIKDFSGVHIEAQFIDLGIIRDHLNDVKLLESTCP